MCKAQWMKAAALLLFAALAQPATAAPLELQGEAQRGETVVHAFEYKGRSFEFRLVPLGHGWSVWIGDPMYRNSNYVAVASPPYRGINPAVIEGWHFRNKDNTGPNKAGSGNVNAPGRTRKFAMVLDGAGYQAAQEAMEILMWPDKRDDAEIQAAANRLNKVPVAPITFEIEALELGNLVKGEQAWIERMAFRMRITLP